MLGGLKAERNYIRTHRFWQVSHYARGTPARTELYQDLLILARNSCIPGLCSTPGRNRIITGLTDSGKEFMYSRVVLHSRAEQNCIRTFRFR